MYSRDLRITAVFLSVSPLRLKRGVRMQIRDDAWVISDTHFGHKNIIAYANRPFPSVEIMNDAMIHNWNMVVGKKDQVLFLGDFATNEKLALDIRSRLNGKITILMGNYERGRSIGWWHDMCFYAVLEYPFIYKDFFILSHEPIEWVSPKIPILNIHGHIHDKAHYGLLNNHYNVSVENINYTPVRLQTILDKGYNLARE
jgi:calcineurin-like phosphoesterase family protein